MAAVELDYALLADAASVDSDGKLYVMGGNVGVIGVEPPPSAVSQLALVATVTSSVEEAGEPSSFTVEIAGPDGDLVVPRQGGELATVAADDHAVARATVVMMLNGVPVTTTGRHNVRIYLDDDLQQTLSFDIEADISGQ